MRPRFLRPSVTGLALLALVGCEAAKSENPLSPSVAGPIPGVTITAPKPLEPSPGKSIRFPDQPLTLLFENASTTGLRPISYSVEVGLDAGFTNKVYTRQGIEPGTNGRTSLRLPDPLAADRSYHWRVWAQDGANTGPYSDTSTFSVLTPVEIQAPALIAPVGGATVTSLQPEMSIRNAARSGPIGAVTYAFEIAKDEAFTAVVATANIGEQAVETRYRVASPLAASDRFFWRVRAYDPTTVGPWSATQWFRTPASSQTPGPSPGPPPAPVPSAPRRIGIDEAVAIIRFVYDDNRYNIGSASTRDQRNAYLERAVAVLHYGHSRYNPQGPDAKWCIKSAGAGRPQSDDVIARCDTREAWDLVGGIGADGYSWAPHYLGVLSAEQHVYAPSASALNALPR